MRKKHLEDKTLKQTDIESLVYEALIHKTNYYGLHLEKGWIGIDTLIYRVNFVLGEDVIDRSAIYKIANKNPKFSMNFFHTKIRANKSGSALDLGLIQSIPPSHLYLISNKKTRTTTDKSIIPLAGAEYIKLDDVLPENSSNENTLIINSEQMCLSGYPFYKSNIGNWYVKKIPIRFVTRYIQKI